LISDEHKYNLPLSWFIESKDKPTNSLSVQINNAEMIYSRSYHTFNNQQIREILQTNNNIIIRGVNKLLAEHLSNNGFYKYCTGSEAVINLKDKSKWKKSLIDLCNRGRKLCKVKEVNYSSSNSNLLRDFKKLCRHSDEPQLQYLFQNDFNSSFRLFVAQDQKLNWIGAAMLSRNNNHRFHCELMLKHKGAPVGIMEYLIDYICSTLKQEGVTEFSLGEVPFINGTLFNTPLYMILKFCRKPLNKIYNYEGLQYFKNKFDPNWEKVFLCSNYRLSTLNFIVIASKINLLKLTRKKLLNIMDY
jgi:hypothetical protein